MERPTISQYIFRGLLINHYFNVGTSRIYENSVSIQLKPKSYISTFLNTKLYPKQF